MTLSLSVTDLTICLQRPSLANYKTSCQNLISFTYLLLRFMSVQFRQNTSISCAITQTKTTTTYMSIHIFLHILFVPFCVIYVTRSRLVLLVIQCIWREPNIVSDSWASECRRSGCDWYSSFLARTRKLWPIFLKATLLVRTGRCLTIVKRRLI